jgi:hypothetical protein
MPTSLEDLAWWASAHGRMIVVALAIVVVCITVLQLRSARRRYRKHQAQQSAIAASLGFRARGFDARESFLRNARESIVDGADKIGPFRRFRGRAIVRVLFEGERNGLHTTIFVQTFPASMGETSSIYHEDQSTTIACFVSPDLDVPPFDLSPALHAPAVIEAVGNMVAKALRPLIGPVDPVVELPGRSRFHELYELRTGFAVSIRDVFTPNILDFFERKPGWSVEALKGRVLVFRENVKEPPERIAPFVAEAALIAEMLRKSP